MSRNYSESHAQPFSPKHIITLGVLLILASIIISTTLTTNTRWLGISFVSHETGLQVSAINENGPAHQRLKPGDIVTAIIEKTGERFPLRTSDIMEDPYDLKLYSEFRDFFERQSRINILLKQDAVTFALSNGREVSLQAASHRPLSSLPFFFWFQLGCGFVSLLIGVSVFAFRQENIAARCLAVSAIGLMAIITAAATYSSRELAIDGRLFYQLTLLNQYGTVLFVALGTAVLWYSPRRISPLPMASILLVLYSLFALLHTLEVWDSLNVGIRFPIFFFVLLLIIFSVYSWRSTRGRPASRAVLKWLLYTWFTSIILFLGLRLVPVALGFESLIPQASAWLILVLIYIGIALGITRYRLFNLDRWVLRAWFWIFSGLAVIALDIGLVSLLEIDTPLATAIALAVIGWVYFPLRQILWTRLAPGLRRVDVETLFPEILEITLSPGQDSELFNKWRDMLQRMYKPLEIKILSAHNGDAVESAHIIRNGIGLRLPALSGGDALELSGAEHANRLFNPSDVRFASAVWGLFNHAVEFRLAFEQGADEERQRIARDLHDDVAARVLTLVHRAEDPSHEKLARQALSALRDTIYTLGSQDPPPLEDMLGDIRHEIQQRLEAVGVQLKCDLRGVTNEIQLNARQHINLQRIMQELVSNVIYHANADTLSIKVVVENNNISIDVCDNGIGGDTKDWTLGKGLNNIKSRVDELNGSIHWQLNQPTGCCIFLQLPIK